MHTMKSTQLIPPGINPLSSLCCAEDLEAKASVDLGTKFKTAGALYKKKFDAPGRGLDLELLWKEKGSEVAVGAVYKHDKLKKVSGK